MSRRSAAALAAVAVCAALVGITQVPVAAKGGGGGFPTVIPLPPGFQPEGIEIGRGTTFYVGSIPTGAIFRGDLRTGEGSVFIPGRTGRAAIGVEEAGGLLFVAGGATGKAFVYDARTGADVAQVVLTTSTTTFINDVVVTRSAAWFTDSRNPVLYRVDRKTLAVTALPLTGDMVQGAGNNANGIDATRDGKTLVLMQSNAGALFTVDPTAGVTTRIQLADDESVPNGDGILLHGRTLYVVQNRLNLIAEIRLDRGLTSGRVVGRTSNPAFDVPSTIDRFGNRLYAVNARFGTATPTPATASYSVVGFPRP